MGQRNPKIISDAASLQSICNFLGEFLQMVLVGAEKSVSFNLMKLTGRISCCDAHAMGKTRVRRVVACMVPMLTMLRLCPVSQGMR